MRRLSLLAGSRFQHRFDSSAGSRRPPDGRTHQGGGAAAVARAGAVSHAHRRDRRAPDGFPVAHAGGALGARSLRGVGAGQRAARAVPVRPRVVARENLGGDDGSALHAAHRLRRRVDAVDRRSRERTGGVHRRQDRRRHRRPGGTASRRHRAHAPAADAVRRHAIGRSPVSTTARCARAIPPARRRAAPRRQTSCSLLLQRAGAAVALQAERVPRRHGWRDRQSRHDF